MFILSSLKLNVVISLGEYINASLTHSDRHAWFETIFAKI